VYLGRQVIVADIDRDPFWELRRGPVTAAGLHASWSLPIKGASGRILGALGVYRGATGLPSDRELEWSIRAAQLAGIAIERRLAEEALRASESKYRGLFETVMEGVFQSTREGKFISVNPALVQMLAFSSAAEIYALPDASVLYRDAGDRAAFMHRIEAQGEVRNAEVCLRRQDGQLIWVLENARAMRDAAGVITGYEGTIADITERKRAEQAVFAEKERALVTLQSIGDAVISTDAAGAIDYMNPVAERLTGWRADEARGLAITEVLAFVDDATRQPVEHPVSRCLASGEPTSPSGHTVLASRSGGEVAITDTASPIRDRQGKVIGAVIVFHDVTRERRLKRALSYQASHDALTGLINRREFDSRLQAAVVAARRGDARYVCMYVDLDQFKVVNDTCGHPAGDRLIREITSILRARVRGSDTIARLGGDEFGVLLEDCSLEQALTIAEGARAAIHEHRFAWGARTLSVGASIGLVEISRETDSVAAVMSAVDIACYAAKDEGRNRVRVYDSGSSSGRHSEMYWVARVTQAVEENRLAVFFQPIVAIGESADQTAFHEFTVRLLDQDGRLVPPSEFIPAAERYNVMATIDRWVVERATELLAGIAAAGRPMPLVAVNLSGTSLNDQGFLEFVLARIAEPQIARALCFEITETAAVANLSSAVYFMRELKSRGCRFSLDDFGSGVSSFMYLKNLPIDFLKIDGQFIANIAHDPVERSMVEAITRVGRTLGIRTIAERVTTQAVLDELARIGVDFAQGFLLAKPRSIAEFPGS
jgi:diguanylate cyclase (GGDEF)-like protein/PAS domain S-box-containing protein